MKGEHPIILDDLRKIVASNIGWEKLSGKTILITGANGFLAAYCAKALLLLNDEKRFQPIKIIALVRNKENAESRFIHLQNREDFKIIVQDVSEKLVIDGDIHFIIHAASQASPKYYAVDPVGTLAANSIGTFNLLTFAKEKNVEGFLYFSSGEVYGQVESKYIPTQENQYGYIDIADVRSCYSESKRMGEVMCVSFFKQYNLSTKIVRPFHTYGPGIDLKDGRVYADFIANILSNENIILKSKGDAQRAFCYISDATIGFFTVLINGLAGEAYNIGNPAQEISIYELASKLVNLFPEKRLKVEAGKQNNNYLQSNISRNSPSIYKANGLGWNPSVSIEQGFYRTIKSYERE
jgi:UDP-glucuronate decarboxylase